MKVYVDELPKECFECPCFEGIETPAFCPCRLDFIENDKVQNYHKFDECNDNVCPLQSLTDYTKQVRKEVLEKVYKVLEQAIPHDLCWSWAVIKKELDQIQGE